MPSNNLSAEQRTPSKWWVAAAILSGQLTGSFGMFAVVVALPKMMTSCGADVSSIQWVMTGYQISRAVPMPALGWMVGLMGSRNLYGLGVIGATLCNMLAPPCSTAGCIPVSRRRGSPSSCSRESRRS